MITNINLPIYFKTVSFIFDLPTYKKYQKQQKRINHPAISFKD